MPDLEDDSDVLPNEGLFSGAYDDEGVGAEADFNNMDNTIDVSPILTLRIHKDHPKEEPKNISQALQDESWVEAMQEELLQFKLQKVWVLVDLPSGKKVIGTKWVFRNKRDERSIVVKNKARLVAQGFRQEEGIDYDEVFAPVSRGGYNVHQPLGFVDPAHPNKVYKGEVKQQPDGIFISLTRSMIGSLMYLTASRPDIMFAVCACARDSPFKLEAFSDSDYGGASLERKSTTCGFQFLGRRLISWQCKKQTIVANSTTEAKYVAAANCYGQYVSCFWANVFRSSMDLRMDERCAGSFSHIWCTATVRTLANGTQELVASIDTKEYTITEASVRSKLQLVDAAGISNLPDAKIYDGLATLGLQLKELMEIIPNLVTRIDDLEKELHQTKNTYGKAVLTLVERVKSLEKALKRKTKKMVMFDSEDGRTESVLQGRHKSQKLALQSWKQPKTLSQVASQTISTYKRRVRSTDKGKDINTSLDAEAEINTGSEDFNTVKVIEKEKKPPSHYKDVTPTRRTKAQIQQEKVGLIEAMRLQALQDEEAARQVHLDALLAKRISEEEELSEQQKKRKAEVLEAAQMVEMIKQKKKYYAEQKAKARRSKPMTQAQQREYMKLKDEFEKLMKNIERFVPMESDERVKRQGVQLEQESSKKQKTIEDVLEEKVEDVKEEEIEKSVKKRGKRRKQLARKGIHVDKTTQSGTKEREAYMKEKVADPSSGQKAVYQIIRANGADKVYMSFGAILKDFSRDDLTKLYRLVIKKYGANRPEEAYDRVLWGDLKTMFDPPLSEDMIWSLPLQQKMEPYSDLAETMIWYILKKTCVELIRAF
ncbi:putative ribonuclease H-like domain-containing protein [Tanacetum coccineum]